MEMEMGASGGITFIEEEIISEEKILKCLKKIKKGKATGTYRIKTDVYKAFIESKPLIETLIKCLRDLFNEGDILKPWKKYQGQ